MGRQINFYMSKQIEQQFFDLLYLKGYSVLYEDPIEKNIYKISSYSELSDKIWMLILYKDIYDPLIYSDHEKEIDRIYGPVIELIRTRKDDADNCLNHIMNL